MVIYLTLTIALLSGLYAYRYLRRVTSPRTAQRIYAAMGLAALLYVGISLAGELSLYTAARAMAIAVLFYACATLPLCIGAVIDDLYRLFRRATTGAWPSAPLKGLFLLSCLLALAGIATVVEGILRGKTDYRVEDFVMESPRVPEGLDGLRIVQISDLHLGSFRPDDRHLPRAFEMIAGLQGDMIVLTGDILNDNSADMLPWMDYLSALHAPSGKYAVIGNHDYCEYDHSLTPAQREAQMDSLHNYYRRAGFQVLDNAHVPIVRGGDTLYLAGVENWGTGPFPARGDLGKALEGIPADAFIVLLSHDPSHFERIVSHYPTFVDLTLSGHTHAMQLAFRLSKNRQWSPIQYRYPYWAGPYRENGRQLYVNRGIGYHFFPARVGMRPEITCITLRRSEGSSEN